MDNIKEVEKIIDGMCGNKKIDCFMGIPLKEFDKETLIKLITISHNELNNYRDTVIKRKTG